MGRARKTIQPDEIYTVRDWMVKKLASNWVYSAGYKEGQHPAYDNLSLMKDEFQSHVSYLPFAEVVRKAGESNDDFAQRQSEHEKDNQASAEWWTTFCEKWLLSKDWTQLKGAIRQKKNRLENKFVNPTKRVEVSEKAARMLHVIHTMSEDYQSPSDVIEKELAAVFKKLKPKYDRKDEADRKAIVNSLPTVDAAAIVCMQLAENKRIGFKSKFEDAPFQEAIRALLIVSLPTQSLKQLVKGFEENPRKWRNKALQKWPELKQK